MQTELEFRDLQLRPKRGPGHGGVRAADQTVGRADDLRRLQEYADRRQDTLVLGPAGVGKSHLLSLVRGPRSVRIRSLSPARQTVLEVAEALFQAGVLRVQAGVAGRAAGAPALRGTAGGALQPMRRAAPAVNAAVRVGRSQAPGSHQPTAGKTLPPAAAPLPAGPGTEPAPPTGGPAPGMARPGDGAVIAPRARTASPRSVRPPAATASPRSARPPTVAPARPDFAAFRKQHTGTTIQGWTRLVSQAVPPQQWLLVIDDLSGLTRVQGQLLDQLGERFAILAAVIELPRSDRKHFARFKRIPLANLSRKDATQLMRQRLAGARMDNPRLVEAYLWHHSVGNPRALLEMIDQLCREPAITEDAARNLDYPGARPQLDLTPIILIPAVFLVAARFVARGLGDTEAYILAGVGAALVMGLQFLLFRLRR